MITVKQVCQNYIIWAFGPDYGNQKRFLRKLEQSDYGPLNATTITSKEVYQWACQWNRPSRLAALQMTKRAYNFAWSPTALQQDGIRTLMRRGVKGPVLLTGVLTEYDNPLYEIGLNYQNYKREHYEKEDQFWLQLEMLCVGLAKEGWQKRQSLKALHSPKGP